MRQEDNTLCIRLLFQSRRSGMILLLSRSVRKIPRPADGKRHAVCSLYTYSGIPVCFQLPTFASCLFALLLLRCMHCYLPIFSSNSCAPHPPARNGPDAAGILKTSSDQLVEVLGSTVANTRDFLRRRHEHSKQGDILPATLSQMMLSNGVSWISYAVMQRRIELSPDLRSNPRSTRLLLLG